MKYQTCSRRFVKEPFRDLGITAVEQAGIHSCAGPWPQPAAGVRGTSEPGAFYWLHHWAQALPSSCKNKGSRDPLILSLPKMQPAGSPRAPPPPRLPGWLCSESRGHHCPTCSFTCISFSSALSASSEPQSGGSPLLAVKFLRPAN